MIARYLLNIYASATLSFLFSMGVVLLFSRLKKPRFLACLFFLPFLKVLWDLLFSSAPNWVYLQNLSVIHAPENSRMLTVYAIYNGLPGCGISLNLFESLWFSIGDILHESWPIFSWCIALSLLAISYFKFTLRITHFLKRHSGTTSCAVVGFWKPKIISSSRYFLALNEKEKAAVLAHEKSHIRWGDHLVHHFLFFFEPLFWFLPFKKWLMKQLYLQQEMACDRAAKAPLDVATALKKALTTSYDPLALNFASPSHKRVKALVETHTLNSSVWKQGVYCLLFGMVFAFILVSEFLPF